MKLVDHYGKPYKIGDYIIYVTRAGSHISIREGRVLGIVASEIGYEGYALKVLASKTWLGSTVKKSTVSRWDEAIIVPASVFSSDVWEQLKP